MNTAEKVIQGRAYIVRPLPAKKGLKLFMKGMKLLGPVLASEDDATITKELLSGLDPDEILEMAESLAEMTMVKNKDGAPVPLTRNGQTTEMFEACFAGNFPAMLEWLMLAIEVNFSGFLDGSGVSDVIDRMKKAKPQS